METTSAASSFNRRVGSRSRTASRQRRGGHRRQGGKQLQTDDVLTWCKDPTVQMTAKHRVLKALVDEMEPAVLLQ